MIKATQIIKMKERRKEEELEKRLNLKIKN